MRILTVVGLLLLAGAGTARAADVCIWNYDTLDRFHDPQVGDSVDCAYWVARTLTDQGHNVTLTSRYLPADISGFDIVFCLMGWYRC